MNSIKLLDAVGWIADVQDRLLVGDLHLDMGGDHVGQVRQVVDALGSGEGLAGHLLVQLDVFIEGLEEALLEGDGVRPSLDFPLDVPDAHQDGLVAGEIIGEVDARDPLHEHLDGAVRQLQELEDLRDGAHPVEVFLFRHRYVRVPLGREHDEPVSLHGAVKGLDRFLPPDKERDDHVGEYDNVSKRQQGIFIGKIYALSHGRPLCAPRPAPSAERRCALV